MNASDTKDTQKGSDVHPALKFAVKGMGVLLVGGIVLMVVLLAMGVHKQDGTDGSASRSGCAPQTVQLEAGEAIDSVDVDGRIATVITRSESGAVRVRRVHVCSGEVSHELVIAPAR